MRKLPKHITATMVRDLAICEHRYHLDLHGDSSLRDPVGVFVQMLWAGGTQASPILVDALSTAGLGLNRVLDTAGETEAEMVGVLRVHPLRREGGSVQLMDPAGILRRCEVQRRGDCLEVSLSLGVRTFVATNRDQAELAIAMTLPDTLRIAAKGRPLREDVDHPLLQRNEYVVRRVREFSRLGVILVGFDAPMTVIDEGIAARLEPRHHEF